MSSNIIEINLNNKQELALSIPTKRLLLTGGIRAGKTTVALIKIREIALRMPGSQILIMRKTLKEIRDDIFKTMYNPTDGLLNNTRVYGKLNKSNYEHNLPNGSKILYRQGDDPKKLLGLDLSCIYFEQAENIDKRIFDFALGRLTHWGDIKNPDSRGHRYIQKFAGGEYANTIAKKPAHFFILSCNPDTGSWIHDDIIRTCPNYSHKTPHIKHPELGWDIVNFQTQDNAQLPDVKNFIEEQRIVTSDTYFRRMIEGEWVGSEGQIYSHFNSEKHILADFEEDLNQVDLKNEHRFEIVVGIDPGSTWYTGIVFGAYDRKYNTTFFFDEIKIRNVLIDEVAPMIKEKLKAYKIDIKRVQFLIDAAANIKESQGISKADQYKQNGIYVINANKVVDGALERINGLFKQNKIAIIGHCVNLINDIKSYYYDEDGKPNKRTGAQAFDMNDAMRYILNNYAYPASYPKEPVQLTPEQRTQRYMAHILNDDNTPSNTNSKWGW